MAKKKKTGTAKKKKVGIPKSGYRKLAEGTPLQTFEEMGVRSAYDYQQLIQKIQGGAFPAPSTTMSPYQYSKSIAMSQIGQYAQTNCPIFTYGNRGGPLKKNGLVIVSMFDRSGRIIDPWREKKVNGKVINKGNICITLDIGAKMYPNWKRCAHVQMDLINGDPCWLLNQVFFGKQLKGLCDVMFAFPPCTNFSRAGTATFGDKVLRDKKVLRYAMNLVDVARNWATHAKFWMIENPSTGSLAKAWRQWDFKFNPHEYSNLPRTWPEKFYDYYGKHTGIWANFSKPPINSIDSPSSRIPALLRKLPRKIDSRKFTKTLSLTKPRPFASQTKKKGNRLGQDQYAMAHLKEYDTTFQGLKPVTALGLTKSTNQAHYARSLTPKGFAIAVYNYLTGASGKKPSPIPGKSWRLTPMSAQQSTKFKQRKVEENPSKKRRRQYHTKADEDKIVQTILDMEGDRDLLVENITQYAELLMSLLGINPLQIYLSIPRVDTSSRAMFVRTDTKREAQKVKTVFDRVARRNAQGVEVAGGGTLLFPQVRMGNDSSGWYTYIVWQSARKKRVSRALKQGVDPRKLPNPSKKQRRQYHTKADEDKIVQDILDMEGDRDLLIANITQYGELLMSLLGIDPLQIYAGIPRVDTSSRAMFVRTDTKREAQKVKTVFDRVARRNAQGVEVAGGGTLLFPQVRLRRSDEGFDGWYTYIRWQNARGKRVSRALKQDVEQLRNPRRRKNSAAEAKKVVDLICSNVGKPSYHRKYYPNKPNLTMAAELIQALYGQSIEYEVVDWGTQNYIVFSFFMPQFSHSCPDAERFLDWVLTYFKADNRLYVHYDDFSMTHFDPAVFEVKLTCVKPKYKGSSADNYLKRLKSRRKNPKRNSAKRRLRRVVTGKNRR